MAAVRNLTLRMGLISANVAAFKATNERRSVELNRVHKHTVKELVDGKEVERVELHPTGNATTCKTCLRNILDTETTKGYQFDKGRYIEVPKSELDVIKLESTDAVIVDETVDFAEFQKRPLLLTGNAYYLAPPAKEKFAPVTFALLRKALLDSNKVGIGKTCMYSHEEVVAILPSDNGFVMYMLRNSDEVRQEETLTLPTINPDQLKLATMVVQAMAVPGLNINATDSYEKALKTLIDNKIAGKEPTEAAAAPVVTPTRTVEEQLQATLALIKQNNAAKEPTGKDMPASEEVQAIAKKTVDKMPVKKARARKAS